MCVVLCVSMLSLSYLIVCFFVYICASISKNAEARINRKKLEPIKNLFANTMTSTSNADSLLLSHGVAEIEAVNNNNNNNSTNNNLMSSINTSGGVGGIGINNSNANAYFYDEEQSVSENTISSDKNYLMKIPMKKVTTTNKFKYSN